jgi:hypothetical protein
MRADITLLCNVDGGQGVTLTFPALFASLRRVNRGGRVTHQASPTAESSVAGRSNAEQVTATETAVSPSEEVNASENSPRH